MFLSYLYLFIYLGISRHTQIPWVSDKTDLFYTGEVILTSFSIINGNNFPCGHFRVASNLVIKGRPCG